MKEKKTYNHIPEQDAFLRNAFKDFEVPYDEVSWVDLSEKLDRLDSMIPLKDQDFKAGLINLQAPYSAGSWDILEQKLKVQDDRKKWLLLGKIAELAMFFLAFYLISGVLDQPFSGGILPEQVKSGNELTFSSDEIHPGRLNIQHDRSAQGQDLNAPIHTKKEFSQSGQSNSTQIQNSKKSSFRNPDHKVWIAEKDPGQALQKQVNPDNKPIQPTELSNSENDQEYTIHQAQTDLVEESKKSTGAVATENVQLDKIPVYAQSIETNASTLESWKMPVLNPGRFGQQKFHVYIGAVAGYDKDLIKSPFPHQLSEVMLGRIEDNFRLGLNLGIDMDYVEFHSGVHWLIKRYKSVYSGVNQVRITNIPLMLKVKLPLAGFMRGYVTGGVSANYVAHANYQEHQYFRDRPNLDYIENNSRAKGISLLSTSSYQNGILEGETFKGNHFYTANIGIGLEANLNKKYSLFFEQSYSHHLKGSSIGPAFDHFFSSTSMAGIRYKIQRNTMHLKR